MFSEWRFGCCRSDIFEVHCIYSRGQKNSKLPCTHNGFQHKKQSFILITTISGLKLHMKLHSNLTFISLVKTYLTFSEQHGMYQRVVQYTQIKMFSQNLLTFWPRLDIFL